MVPQKPHSHRSPIHYLARDHSASTGHKRWLPAADDRFPVNDRLDNPWKKKNGRFENRLNMLSWKGNSITNYKPFIFVFCVCLLGVDYINPITFGGQGWWVPILRIKPSTFLICIYTLKIPCIICQKIICKDLYCTSYTNKTKKPWRNRVQQTGKEKKGDRIIKLFFTTNNNNEKAGFPEIHPRNKKKRVVSVGWMNQTFTNGKWLEITKHPLKTWLFRVPGSYD